MQTFTVALSICCLLAISLIGCSDWRLRGSDDHVIASKIFLDTDAGSEKSTVYRQVYSELAGLGALTLRQQAESQLILGKQIFKRRTISVDNNLRAAEFQLTLTVPFKVLNQQGEILRKATALSTRSYGFSEQDIVGKDKEEALLKKEMVRDIARQILYQLRLSKSIANGL